MKDVIIACDFSSTEKLYSFLEMFGDEKPYIKIGMELFYKTGSNVVSDLAKRGFKIFLDLKLHDIPNTVYKAMRNIAGLGVEITNVHASGGIEMMKMAKKGLLEGAVDGKTPKLIAVTQLTSTDERMLKEELLIDAGIANTVKKYAENAKEAGLDGVVCSPLEAPIIKEMGMLSVTPGIRLATDAVGDQKRVTTPEMARELGSAYIVVGRTITDAENPLKTYKLVRKQFLGL